MDLTSIAAGKALPVGREEATQKSFTVARYYPLNIKTSYEVQHKPLAVQLSSHTSSGHTIVDFLKNQ